jgi:hypothetical protein
MKTISKLAFELAAVALLAAGTGATATTATLTLGTVSVSAGSAANVNLTLANNGTAVIAALTTDITYNPSVLTPTGVTTAVAGKIAQGNIVSAGDYRITVYGGVNTIADGTVATVSFNTTTGQCGTYTLGNASGTPTASDASANPVAITGVAGALTTTGCGGTAGTPILTIGTVSVSAGSAANVNLTLANNGTAVIAALTTDITYNPSVLTPTGVTTAVAGKIAQGNIVSAGDYRITVYGGVNTIADGTVATVSFNTTTGQCGTYTLGNASGTPTASDASANPVAITGVAGALTTTGCGGINYSYSMWVPVASHSGGLNNSQWRTDLGLLNTNSVTANVKIEFYGSGGVVSNTTYIPAGVQWMLTDVVGVGELGTSGSGALEILSDQPVRIMSRTYNLVSAGATCYPNGTQGQDYPAFAATDGFSGGQVGYLTGLTENSSRRCNIGVVNTGSTVATVLVELFNGAGAKLTGYTVSLAAGQWAQETQPFYNKAGQTAMDRGYAKITVQTGSGVLAFASIVDNITNDPTTVTIQP